jgi:hypothetical protein
MYVYMYVHISCDICTFCLIYPKVCEYTSPTSFVVTAGGFSPSYGLCHMSSSSCCVIRMTMEMYTTRAYMSDSDPAEARLITQSVSSCTICIYLDHCSVFGLLQVGQFKNWALVMKKPTATLYHPVSESQANDVLFVFPNLRKNIRHNITFMLSVALCFGDKYLNLLC